MSQTESPTNEGYGEWGKLGAGESATCVDYVGVIITSCTANESQNYAGQTWASNGCGVQAADSVISSTTTVSNDTIELDHVFTATGSVTAKGFGVVNTDQDVLYMICCFAADIPLATSDTLTVEGKMQFKLGS